MSRQRHTDIIAGSAAGSTYNEGEGPLEAHEAPKGISRRVNTASGGRAHVGKRLSWHESPPPAIRSGHGLNIPESMPPGGTESPRGDLGLLRGTEAIAACPDIKKMRSSVMKASTYLPAPKELS